MSNLFKSKFLLGVMVVAAVFVFVGFSKPTQAAADCSITSTLRLGSTGTQVVCLQTALGGLTPDGSFGPLTKAAVVSWQSKSGLVADGIFGPKSNAVWMANQGNVGVFPAGCTSAVGYSSSTGLSCYAAPANTFAPSGCTSASGYSPVTGAACYVVGANPPATGFTPAGCTSANGFSPVTGGACQSLNLPAGCTSTAGFSPTTGGSCSGSSSTVVSNGAGSLSLIATTADVENQAPEGVVTKVLGIKAQASGSDISVGYVNVTLENRSTFATDSTRLDHYASEVSVWVGTTKVGSALASDFTKSGNIYTATIPVSGAVVKVGSLNKVNFYVAVTPLTNIDSGDASGTGVTASDNFWNVAAGGFRFTDGTGLTLSGADPVTNTNFSFAKIATSGDLTLKVTQSSNPVAANVAVSSSTTTSSILLNSFTMKPVGADMTMTTLALTTTTTGTGTGTGIAQNLTLTADGVQVAEIDSVLGGANATVTTNIFTLDNDLVMKAGSTVTFKVYAKVNKIGTLTFAQGDSLLASYLKTGTSVEATNGGANLSTLLTGSSNGNAQKFYSQGVSVSNFTSSISHTNDTNGLVTTETYIMNFDVSAFGQTYYLDNRSVRNELTAAHAGQGAVFQLLDGSGSASALGTANGSVLTSSASVVGGDFEIPDGMTKSFTFSVVLSKADDTSITGHAVIVPPGFYQVQLLKLRYSATTGDAAPSELTLSPATSFQTAAAQIQN